MNRDLVPDGLGESGVQIAGRFHGLRRHRLAGDPVPGPGVESRNGLFGIVRW
jgi:hypothetical protein